MDAMKVLTELFRAQDAIKKALAAMDTVNKDRTYPDLLKAMDLIKKAEDRLK